MARVSQLFWIMLSVQHKLVILQHKGSIYRTTCVVSKRST